MATYFHCQRVAGISRHIAFCLELTSAEQTEVVRSASLHDLGKINIPREILRYPGNLRREDWDIIRRHPEEGAAMARGFPKQITDGIISHHEHFDGSGYPGGLKSENIPLIGRIIAIADAFDAMLTPRVYHIKTCSVEEAAIEIVGCAGKQFDPYIVSKIIRSPTNQIYESLFLTYVPGGKVKKPALY